MNDVAESGGAARNIPWRLIGWGAAVVLLLLPFIAMQMQVLNWGAEDFIFVGALLGIVGTLFEFGVRASKDRTYRFAYFLGLLAGFATIWVNLAVGIVGSDDNPSNGLFMVALMMGVGGAIGAKLEAEGMARTMLTTAVAIAVAFIIAQIGLRDERMVQPIVETVGTSMFVMLFLGSAWLFRRAARQSA